MCRENRWSVACPSSIQQCSFHSTCILNTVKRALGRLSVAVLHVTTHAYYEAGAHLHGCITDLLNCMYRVNTIGHFSGSGLGNAYYSLRKLRNGGNK